VTAGRYAEVTGAVCGGDRGGVADVTGAG
jgi:hypothetical protein